MCCQKFQAMSQDSPLEPIWQSYVDTLDCLNVTSRCISDGAIEYLEKTSFSQEKVSDARRRISESRKSADDLVIVSLWAVFERVLIDHLQSEGRRILHVTPSAFTAGVHQKIDGDIERWRVGEMLDLFKSSGVDPSLLGSAKDIKKYRDWVAHKNPKKIPPNVPPSTAYRTLSELHDQLATVFGSAP